MQLEQHRTSVRTCSSEMTDTAGDTEETYHNQLLHSPPRLLLPAAPEAVRDPSAAREDDEGGDLHATTLPLRQGRRVAVRETHNCSVLVYSK